MPSDPHNDRCASLLGQGCDCRSPWATDTAGLCAWCSTAPPLAGRIVCSEQCGEAYKQWAIACEVVNGCIRDGQCVLPNGHATGCDWGGEDA